MASGDHTRVWRAALQRDSLRGHVCGVGRRCKGCRSHFPSSLRWRSPCHLSLSPIPVMCLAEPRRDIMPQGWNPRYFLSPLEGRRCIIAPLFHRHDEYKTHYALPVLRAVRERRLPRSGSQGFPRARRCLQSDENAVSTTCPCRPHPFLVSRTRAATLALPKRPRWCGHPCSVRLVAEPAGRRGPILEPWSEIPPVCSGANAFRDGGIGGWRCRVYLGQGAKLESRTGCQEGAALGEIASCSLVLASVPLVC